MQIGELWKHNFKGTLTVIFHELFHVRQKSSVILESHQYINRFGFALHVET